MANKKTNIGNVIGQVGGFRIRQKASLTAGANVKKRQVVSTEIGIFRGKNVIETGFRTKSEAEARAKQLSK